MGRYLNIGDTVVCIDNGIIGVIARFYCPTGDEEQTVIITEDGSQYHAPSRTWRKVENMDEGNNSLMGFTFGLVGRESRDNLRHFSNISNNIKISTEFTEALEKYNEDIIRSVKELGENLVKSIQEINKKSNNK